MGVRNIARLQSTRRHDWLTAGWVGPDAGVARARPGARRSTRRPTIITSAGNQGWPYCMGNKQPYRDRSNTDATALTGWYDCDLWNGYPEETNAPYGVAKKALLVGARPTASSTA